MKIPIFDYHVIKPLERFGFTHSFWHVHIDTLKHTWIAMGILFVIVFFARIFLKKKLNSFSLLIEMSIDTFVNLSKESFGKFRYDYFSFITSLFFFVLFCNLVGTLPFVEEPTRDLNTALACGITGFLYVQYQQIRHIGIIDYGKEYMKPIFILLPLNIIGELAKAASMAFRLFGNILGGSIVLYILIDALESFKIYIMIYAVVVLAATWCVKKFISMKYVKIHKTLTALQILLFSVAGIQLFFGAFEAVIQAFVITMLITTYLSIVAQKPDDEISTNIKLAEGAI